MVDTVSTHTVFAGTREYVINIINVSDGTGESAVIKVDKSTLLSSLGAEPTSIAVVGIQGVVTGMRVDLYWDHTSDVKIATLDAGYHEHCWERWDGIKDTGTGGTGDIILTTTGHSSGDCYDITLKLRLVA